MNDPATRLCLRAGWLLLALFLPLGLTLEALHALKLPVYFGSALRRELWTLAHAHGNLLGLLCLLAGALGERLAPSPAARLRLARLLVAGSFLMPLGFLGGGVLNREGDPSLPILAVPVGGVVLLVALVAAWRGAARAAPPA